MLNVFLKEKSTVLSIAQHHRPDLSSLEVIAICEEGDGCAFHSRSPRAANAMDIVLRILRRVVIDHQSDALHIQATSRHVCGANDLRIAVAQVVQSPLAILLLLSKAITRRPHRSSALSPWIESQRTRARFKPSSNCSQVFFVLQKIMARFSPRPFSEMSSEHKELIALLASSIFQEELREVPHLLLGIHNLHHLRTLLRQSTRLSSL